jgi:hypothetical protein
MEKLILFRIFLWFTIIGLLMFDINDIATGARIPSTHIIMLITLFSVLSICTLAIWHKKKEHFKSHRHNSHESDFHL